MRKKVTPIPWIANAGDYDVLLTVMGKRAGRMPFSYAAWLTSADLLESALSTAGQVVLKVPVHPLRFRDWCQERDRVPDRPALHAYAAEGTPFLRKPT